MANVAAWSWSYLAQQAVMFGFWFLFLRLLYGDIRHALRKFTLASPARLMKQPEEVSLSHSRL